jgi:drug/metabolite transporter (DMT)-like permease
VAETPHPGRKFPWPVEALAAPGYECRMIIPRKLPLKVAFGLVLAIVVDSAIQIFWKTAVLDLPDDASFFAIFKEPLFLVVITIMTLQFFNWMVVLANADLSFAQPVTALSYVCVAVMSAIFLRESVDVVQMLGIALVIAGVYFISRTDHLTKRAEPEADNGLVAEHLVVRPVAILPAPKLAPAAPKLKSHAA